jgi:hypothetical protein
LQHVTGEEVKQEEKKVEHSKEVEELVYKYPTRSRITRARILDELNKLGKRQEADIESYLETKPNHGINPNAIEYRRELPKDPLLRRMVERARKERENSRTSIFNKKALVRQDQ